jgi:L-serine dehydratase
MNESIFELFQIGIGPSSSHTMGPMRAACSFARRLHADCIVDQVDAVSVQLFGSLALTGKGHGTGRAVILGLAGLSPEGIDPDRIEPILAEIRTSGILNLDVLLQSDSTTQST